MLKPVLAALAISLTAAAASAATPEGVWSSPTKHGEIEVYACGADLCGRIVSGDDIRANPDFRDSNNKDAALRTRRLKGVTIMTGMHGGPTEWTGGHLYDPQSGGTYHGSATLADANTLKLKGCLIGPLCRTQTWTRLR